MSMSKCNIRREGDEYLCHTHGTRWDVEEGESCPVYLLERLKYPVEYPEVHVATYRTEVNGCFITSNPEPFKVGADERRYCAFFDSEKPKNLTNTGRQHLDRIKEGLKCSAKP